MVGDAVHQLGFPCCEALAVPPHVSAAVAWVGHTAFDKAAENHTCSETRQGRPKSSYATRLQGNPRELTHNLSLDKAAFFPGLPHLTGAPVEYACLNQGQPVPEVLERMRLDLSPVEPIPRLSSAEGGHETGM